MPLTPHRLGKINNSKVFIISVLFTFHISRRYCSFKKALNSGDLSVKTPEQGPVVKSGKNDLNSYYNTISDPVYPWFRGNGLPASKALHDDRIAFYCHDMSKVKPASTSESDEKPKEVVVQNPKRPTSIQLNLKDSGKKKSKTQNLNLNLKKDPPGTYEFRVKLFNDTTRKSNFLALFFQKSDKIAPWCLRPNAMYHLHP